MPITNDPNTPISLGDLKTEFNDTGSSSLSEFYRIDGLVPDNASNANVPRQDTSPADGQNDEISISDFRGTTNIITSSASPNLMGPDTNIFTRAYSGTEVFVDIQNMSSFPDLAAYLIGFRFKETNPAQSGTGALGSAALNDRVVFNNAIGTAGTFIRVTTAETTTINGRLCVPVSFTPSIADGQGYTDIGGTNRVFEVVADVKLEDTNGDITTLTSNVNTTQGVSIFAVPELATPTELPLSVVEGNTATFNLDYAGTTITTNTPQTILTASGDPRLNAGDLSQTLSFPSQYQIGTTNDTTASAGYDPLATTISVSAKFVLGGNPVVGGVIVAGGEANPTIGNFQFTLTEDVSTLTVNGPYDQNGLIPVNSSSSLSEGRDGFRVDITHASASGDAFNVYLDPNQYNPTPPDTATFYNNGSDTVAITPNATTQVFFGTNFNQTGDTNSDLKTITFYANSDFSQSIGNISYYVQEESNVLFDGQFSGSAVDSSASAISNNPPIKTLVRFLGSAQTIDGTTYNVGDIISSTDGFVTATDIGNWATFPAGTTDVGDVEYSLFVPFPALITPTGFNFNDATASVGVTPVTITNTTNAQFEVVSGTKSGGGSYSYTYTFTPTISEIRTQGVSGNGLHPDITNAGNLANADDQQFNIDHIFTRIGPAFSSTSYSKLYIRDPSFVGQDGSTVTINDMTTYYLFKTDGSIVTAHRTRYDPNDPGDTTDYDIFSSTSEGRWFPSSVNELINQDPSIVDVNILSSQGNNGMTVGQSTTSLSSIVNRILFLNLSDIAKDSNGNYLAFRFFTTSPIDGTGNINVELTFNGQSDNAVFSVEHQASLA